MDKVNIKSVNCMIEINEMPEDKIAGRTRIKMTSNLIHKNNTEYNDNGITWLREYVEANIASANGMPYVVSWMDEENQIPSDHGRKSYDEDGNIQFDGVTVGTVLSAEIKEVLINGERQLAMVTEGYLYNQRYPKFVKWLKEEVKNDTVFGSIEINGKGDSKTIEYLDGNKNADGTIKMGRIPTVFDFTGLAILYIAEPSDKGSQVIELNSKHKDEENDCGKDQGEFQAVKIDNSKESAVDGEWSNPESRLYDPLLQESNSDSLVKEAYLIVEEGYEESPSTKLKYPHHVYRDGKLVLHIRGVQSALSRLMSNEPNNEQAKRHLLRHYRELELEIPESLENKKEENNDMNFEEKYNQVQTELNELKVSSEKEIGKLKDQVEANEKAIEEKDEAIVNATKECTSLKEKLEGVEAELNAKTETLDALEKEKATAEVNAYFEKDIKANGFTEDEINSLKTYVENVDLEGLKKAESDLCTSKWKANAKSTNSAEVEENSVNDNMIKVQSKEQKSETVSFFQD